MYFNFAFNSVVLLVIFIHFIECFKSSIPSNGYTDERLICCEGYVPNLTQVNSSLSNVLSCEEPPETTTNVEKVNIICECKVGYKQSEEEKTMCRPQTQCDIFCLNGSCTGDFCSCNDGYMKENDYTCTPTCSKCSHGTCVAPNTCECSPGYVKLEASEDSSDCMPNCETCKNNCSSWEKCPSDDETENFIEGGDIYCFGNCSDLIDFETCEKPTHCLPEDLIVKKSKRAEIGQIGTWTYVTISLSVLLIASLVVFVVFKRHAVKHYFRKGSVYSDLEDNLEDLPESNSNTLNAMMLSNLKSPGL